MGRNRFSTALAATTLCVIACSSAADVDPTGGAGSTDAGSDLNDSSTPASVVAVGGTVAGLVGSGLVLQNDNGDEIAVTGNGSFAFATKLATGTPYAVTVKTQPSGPTQSCVVSSGTGTTGTTDVSNVVVDCAVDKYTVGGTVSGLTGTLVLTNNGGDDKTITADGAFTFATPIENGGAYAVAVKTQPTDIRCTVTNGSGSVSTKNVEGVIVTCLPCALGPMTFDFTGAEQTLTVPACAVAATIQVLGAQGSDAAIGGTGGLGGSAEGELTVAGGDVLHVFVGGRNGYNGGGAGGQIGNGQNGIKGAFGPSGGGASDVRLNGTALSDRVIVAGGGGGAGTNGVWEGCQVAGPAGNGGAGGALAGLPGTAGVGTPCNCQGGGGDGGKGGTESAGGAYGDYAGGKACLRASWSAGESGTLGQGGAGSLTYYNGTGGGGGGGGGYYGGGSGGSGSDTTPGGGGGGGSSFVGTLTNPSTTAGVRSGDGVVTITFK